MQAVRHFIAQRHLAVLLCVATLLLKLLVPTGYMIGDDHGRPTITVCSGMATRTMAMDMPGMDSAAADHGKSKDHGKAEMPCVFSALSAAVMGATDPIQLAALVAFVLALGLAAIILPGPSRPARLRPPLRAPPAYL
jgi:hypothetical protein